MPFVPAFPTFRITVQPFGQRWLFPAARSLSLLHVLTIVIIGLVSGCSGDTPVASIPSTEADDDAVRSESLHAANLGLTYVIVDVKCPAGWKYDWSVRWCYPEDVQHIPNDWSDWPDPDWPDEGGGGGSGWFEMDFQEEYALSAKGYAAGNLLSQQPPNCNNPSDPYEEAWCDGDEPEDQELAVLQTIMDNRILPNCPGLSTYWDRAKGNLRIFDWDGHDFEGAAAVNGDWLVLSRRSTFSERASNNIILTETLLLHEVLHLAGYDHCESPEAAEGFEQEEKVCNSEGRSWLEFTTASEYPYPCTFFVFT